MASFREILEKNGNLNPISFEKYSLKLDIENEFNSLFVMKRAIEKVYEFSLEDKEEGPYFAVCLASLENPTGREEGKFNFNRSIIQVIARIPKLHGAIPKPYLVGENGLGCQGYVRAAINMHPTFYAETGITTPLPKPGNIIKVDISSADSKYGEYLGIVDSSTIVDSCADFYASKAFDNETSVVRALGDVNGGGSNG
jgi:hypothetical protein